MLAFVPAILGGCFTGQRPSFSDEMQPATTTGEPAIDAVLAALDADNGGPFTASYDVLTKFGNTHHTATVAVQGGQRSITVGEVRYLFSGGVASTCTLGGACAPDTDQARISDTGITVDFYGTSTAQRLRRDALARIAPTISRTDTIAGQPANCVDLGVTGGTAVYCALIDGPLALLDDGDVRVVLTGFTATVDPALLAP